MPNEGPPARPADPRLSTGNPGLDAMLEGGLLPHRPYLLIGPAGTGKTTLALQFLCEGVRRGERSLLVTLEEPPNEARINHRALLPELEKVEVFDAIPDIMRYERAPFKDIAAVRSAIPFHDVSQEIRHTPELTSVEVTMSALEQLLRSEVQRRGYTRVAIDSLTALQYFCMKGIEPVGGAQTFLRFLSDLRVTTVLTVESPLEDLETAERMLARGEIRLFRWERDGLTVRAVGVEKFRGSAHDVRLHPYRIGPRGIDIQLDVTISRDTRQIIEPTAPPIVVTVEPPPVDAATLLDPLAEEIDDLIAVGADVVPLRFEVEAARVAAASGDLDLAGRHLTRATAFSLSAAEPFRSGEVKVPPRRPGARAALKRMQQRAETARTGVPPTALPPATELEAELANLLDRLPASAAVVPPPPVEEPAPSPEPPPLVVSVPAPEPAAPTPLVPPSSVLLPPPEEPVGPTVVAPADVPPEAPAAPAPEPAPEPLPELTAAPDPLPESVAPAPEAPSPPPSTPIAPALLEVDRPPVVSPAAPTRETFPEPPPLPAGLPSLPDEPEIVRAKVVPTTVVSMPAPAAPLPEPPLPSTSVAAPSPEATVVVAAPAPKKRRRSPAATKKRAPAAPTDTGPVDSSAGGPATSAPASEAPAGPSPPSAEGSGPPATPPPKPKRRAPRKRKAPPVVAATADALPPPAAATPESPPAAVDAKPEGG